jgi:hypothetical protein
MQLVAYGAQDIYLTGNPQITFWKVTYRRHTNFAMESIEQTFNGAADFGRRVTCTISRNGDLAYRTYLQVTLPEIGQSLGNTSGDSDVYARWLDFPGHQLIDDVEVEIGGQRIDKQYGDWMQIWNQLTLDKNQERGYNKMVMARVIRLLLARYALLVTRSLRPLFTFLFSSGSAITPALPSRLLPSSTTRSRLTLTFAQLTSAFSLYPVFLRPAVTER